MSKGAEVWVGGWVDIRMCIAGMCVYVCVCACWCVYGPVYRMSVAWGHKGSECIGFVGAWGAQRMC